MPIGTPMAVIGEREGAAEAGAPSPATAQDHPERTQVAPEPSAPVAAAGPPSGEPPSAAHASAVPSVTGVRASPLAGKLEQPLDIA